MRAKALRDRPRVCGRTESCLLLFLIRHNERVDVNFEKRMQLVSKKLSFFATV